VSAAGFLGLGPGRVTSQFSGCAKNDLGSTNSLRAGAKRSGQVAFDVKSAKGTVELTPGMAADTVGSWRSS
jgi:hypothetical protein